VYGDKEFQKINTWDNHGGAVYCADTNHDEVIQWASDELKIKYAGKKEVDGESKSSTCYVTTKNFCDMGLCESGVTYRNLNKRGYISAEIKLDKISEDLAAGSIWPAFWILNYQAAEWPMGGELDIAERQNSVTREHIIIQGEPEWKVQDMLTWPETAMEPGNGWHQYGFEWNFVDGPDGLDQLDFTSFYDGEKIGETASCFYSDKDDTACRYIFTGMVDGRMEVIFDADSVSDQEYMMSVSKVSVYDVGA
jgi:hypothetical protein